MGDMKVEAGRPMTPDTVDDPEFRGRLAEALGSNYTVDTLLGEGGFGRVYGGMDVRLQRQVAIKVIRPDLAGARAFLDRFRKEAMAMAKFRHPGIVPIYDIQETNGLVYIVMPMIAGDTIRVRLERHRVIAPQETRKLLVELCECLAASHRAGIIHRDIKPDNVILEGGAISRALLMDFGIAKSMADSDGLVTGTMTGTPTYMSPEQANGDSTIDHRSDIYSVGVLGYHMLTGRPPFVGTSPREVIMGHMMRKPDSIRKLNPSVPMALSDAIMRCLEKDPNDRFPDAMELSAALQNVSFGEIQPYSQTPNNAWPYFAGVATVALGAAALAGQVDLGGRELWWIAEAFVLIAIVCSPVARALTGPLSHRLNDWIRLRRRRTT